MASPKVSSRMAVWVKPLAGGFFSMAGPTDFRVKYVSPAGAWAGQVYISDLPGHSIFENFNRRKSACKRFRGGPNHRTASADFSGTIRLATNRNSGHCHCQARLPITAMDAAPAALASLPAAPAGKPGMSGAWASALPAMSHAVMPANKACRIQGP